jgi:shikimate kinase
MLDAANAAFLQSKGPCIYLELDKSTLKKRLLSGTLPSYLDPQDPDASFEAMYKYRKPLYEARATHTLCITALSETQATQALCALIHTLEDSHGK